LSIDNNKLNQILNIERDPVFIAWIRAIIKMIVTIRKIMKIPKSKCIPLAEFLIKGFFMMK